MAGRRIVKSTREYIFARAGIEDNLLSQSHRRNSIGLLGPYSFGNMGNAALQQALAQQITRYFPGSEIYVRAGDEQHAPLRRTQLEDTGTPPRENWKTWVKRIPFVKPLYRFARAIASKCQDFAEECAFLWRAYKFARHSRMLVVGLGGVVDDLWNGPWGDAFSLFKWAVIAKIADAPFIFLSVGAERLETPLGRFFLRRALALAGYRSFRDEGSKRKVEAMGVTGPNLVFPDLAFSLEIPNQGNAGATRVPRRFVGVSPMAYCDPRVWPIKDPVVYSKYLKTLSQLVLWLLRENYRVALVTTQIRMDRAPLRELKEMVLQGAPPGAAERLSEPEVQTVDQFLSFASGLDLFVTSRLHGVVLPFLVNTPVLAFSHSEKIDWLMADMDLSDYCVDIKCDDVDQLSRRILAIESNQEILRERIRRKVSEYRASLQIQYDRVFRT